VTGQKRSVHFDGKLLATGPTIGTKVQIQVVVDSQEEWPSSLDACTCVYCRMPCTPNRTNPALCPEAYR
jgi:hypothetical protein